MDRLALFLSNTGIANMDWGQLAMIGIAALLIYLAIAKHWEPLLLIPIAFGILLGNMPMAGLFRPYMGDPVLAFNNMMVSGQDIEQLRLQGAQLGLSWPHGGQAGFVPGGVLYYLFQGVWLAIYPSLIFLGIGAMTDFSPLISNPKMLLLGAAAQIGIFFAFIGAILLGFTPQEAASIGIIGGADGPTAIYLTTKLAPQLLAPIAVAAYSYIALVPMIQPPIILRLTTKKERSIVMPPIKPAHKAVRIAFPVVVTIVVGLLVPASLAILGMMMLGNLLKESGVVDRLAKTASNELINTITIFLCLSIGASAQADKFFSAAFLKILFLGLAAFVLSTAGGVFFGKFMMWISKGKINPLCGSAGVSAVPEAARLAQKLGQQANPSNFLLMHAMGPNVAGVIGSAVSAGVLLALFQSIAK